MIYHSQEYYSLLHILEHNLKSLSYEDCVCFIEPAANKTFTRCLQERFFLLLSNIKKSKCQKVLLFRAPSAELFLRCWLKEYVWIYAVGETASISGLNLIDAVSTQYGRT